MTTMFTLPPIPSTSFFPLRQVEASSSKTRIAKLPTIQPEYALQDVDEYEWQGDKLLPAVERGMEWAKPLRPARHGVEAGCTNAYNRKGKQREEVRAVEEGIWAERAELAFPHVDRLALSSGADDPFRLQYPPAAAAESVFGLLDSDPESQQPIHLPKLDAEPASQLSATQLLPVLFLRAGLLQSEVKHVKWDATKATYRLSSRRLAQVGNEDLANRAELPLRVASAMERLDILCGQPAAERGEDDQTNVALRYATRTYLAHCRSVLVGDQSGAATGSGEDVDLKDVEQALAAVCSIWSWPLDTQSARPAERMPLNELLSHIYQELVATSNTDPAANAKRLALAYFLQNASRPLFRLIAAWVGLLPEPSALPSFSHRRNEQSWVDIGITEHTSYVAGSPRTEYVSDAALLPAFISPQIGERIFEGGKSLRLLRDASPGHPAAEHWNMPFVWDWASHGRAGPDLKDVHMQSMRRKMDKWRDGLESRAATPVSRGGSRSALSGRTKVRQPMPDDFRSSSDGNGATRDEKLAHKSFEHAVALPENSLTSDIDTLSSLLASSRLALPSNATAWSEYLQHHVFALPLAHADEVNQALVTLIFDELHYASHLDVLHAYWLGGDAAFSERVAAALLGVGRDDLDGKGETGMGRRARTRARMGLTAQKASGYPAAGADPTQPTDEGADATQGDAPPAEWGIALGVGLSDRQRWPPGGSEMAYALRTTLVDAEISGAASSHCTEQARAEVWDKVQDTVSFAIRPLPQDEERKRAWMDPQSIEALDFLFLAYSPPPSLSIVLPRGVLDRYQAIHNHLLRFSRAQVVLRGMYRDMTRRPADIPSLAPEILGIATELRVGMTNFVETSVKYLIDVAIGANIGEMQRRLSRMRPRRIRQTAPSDLDIGDDLLTNDKDQDQTNRECHAEEADPETDESGVSVQSLVNDHSDTLDTIFRCCLLGGDEQSEMAYDALMRLLSLVLDAGKVIATAVNGWTDDATTLSELMQMRDGWKEAETWFARVIARIARAARDANASSSTSQQQRGKAVELALREWLLRLDLYMGTIRPSQANEES